MFGAGVRYLSLSRDTVPEWILYKKVKEDCSLRATRDGHSSSSSMSPTLLVFLHRLQVHLSAVLCTFSICAIWVSWQECQIGAAYSSCGRTNVLYVTSLVCLGAKAKLCRRKPIVLVALHEISETCWPQSLVCDGYTKIFCRLNLFQFLLMEGVFKLYLILREVPGHPHWMTFGKVKFYLPIGLLLCEAVQVILQDLAIHGVFYIPIQHTIIRKRRTDDLIFSGRSLIKIRKRDGPKTDPWGTPDRIRTGSEAWPSNTTFWERSESHEMIHLWVDPLIP